MTRIFWFVTVLPFPFSARRWCCCALLALSSAACSSVVKAPASVRDPVAVFVLEEALHTGLVLPPTPGASGSPECYVEFGFGDWGFYALEDTGWWGSLAAVLWPTDAALARRRFDASTPDALRARAPWATLAPVVVERAAAAELRARLQERFDAGRRQVVVDRRFGFKFVPADASYWLPQNCADVVAEWLEELGCEVGWAPVRVGLYVAPRSE